MKKAGSTGAITLGFILLGISILSALSTKSPSEKEKGTNPSEVLFKVTRAAIAVGYQQALLDVCPATKPYASKLENFMYNSLAPDRHASKAQALQDQFKLQAETELNAQTSKGELISRCEDIARKVSEILKTTPPVQSTRQLEIVQSDNFVEVRSLVVSKLDPTNNLISKTLQAKY